MFRDSVQRHGAKFVLVTLSNPEQIHGEVQQEAITQHQVSFDVEQPDIFLERLTNRNGIRFLKLMPVLKDYHLKTGAYLHGFGSSRGRGHWNENGHQIAAEKIYEFLYEQHLVPLSAQDGLPMKAIQR